MELNSLEAELIELENTELDAGMNDDNEKPADHLNEIDHLR